MNEELTPSERAALRARIVGGAHGIKPVGAHRNAWIAGSVAAVLVVAIAGGVAATTTLSAPEIATTPSPSLTATTEPAPTVAPVPTPTPTPMPTLARLVSVPSSRFSFGCDQVAETVRAYFDGVVPETRDTRPTPRGNLLTEGPMQYSFAQAGAVYCEFGEEAGTWLTVAVVPDAQGAIEDRNSFNGGVCDPSYPPCELVDGSLVLVEGLSATSSSEAAVSAVNDAYSSMRDLVLSSPPSPAVWSPPTGTTPLTGDCSAFLPADRLGQILGANDLIVQPMGRGGWSLRAWMLSGFWDAPLCEAHQSGTTPYEDPLSVSIVGLPGGEWAYDEGASGDVLPVTGGRSTDAARLDCTREEYGPLCRLDVLVDGNWLRISVPNGVGEAASSSVATQIAELIYAQVYD